MSFKCGLDKIFCLIVSIFLPPCLASYFSSEYKKVYGSVSTSQMSICKYINKELGIEIYTEYRDRELSSNFIKEIMEHKNPREAFQDELCEWAMDYAIEYGEDELEKDIRKELTEEENELF